MSDDFSKVMTIGEIAQDKSQNAKDWSPRDALIYLLRSIDAGEIAPTRIVIAHGYVKETGETSTTVTRAGTVNAWESLGLLDEAKAIIAES